MINATSKAKLLLKERTLLRQALRDCFMMIEGLLSDMEKLPDAIGIDLPLSAENNIRRGNEMIAQSRTMLDITETLWLILKVTLPNGRQSAIRRYAPPIALTSWRQTRSIWGASGIAAKYAVDHFISTTKKCDDGRQQMTDVAEREREQLDIEEAPLAGAQAVARIDTPLERRRVGDMVVDKFAGLTFTEYREAIEFSKLMAQAKNSIPLYLKNNAGDCLAIVTQSLRWRLEPYWVAQHSYVARAESLIAYDAAVHAAIVISSGLLKGRPRYIYSGEGEDRICTVSATFIGETEPHEYITPPLGKARPPKNESGTVKGSPLWTKDPDQQLGYYAMRNWGRRHCPEILGGVYDREEFDETTQDTIDVSPASPRLMERLPGKMEGAGFQTDVVDAGLAEKAKAEKGGKKAGADAPEAIQSVSEPPLADVPKATEQRAQKPAAAPREPKTDGEYLAYAAKWIEAAPNADDAEARWDGEKDMRADLKLPLGARKRLEGMLKSRIAASRTEKRR